ncbi:GTPase domain-containing protein [Legionella spiritensis]|uniref:GTPase domain-containing protein n=1 Tax=Legionella spiritensis TaxID=452 RepID=UPI000F8484F5|nr:GTPase domain-containing protein [Legionella spiritensis]
MYKKVMQRFGFFTDENSPALTVLLLGSPGSGKTTLLANVTDIKTLKATSDVEAPFYCEPFAIKEHDIAWSGTPCKVIELAHVEYESLKDCANELKKKYPFIDIVYLCMDITNLRDGRDKPQLVVLNELDHWLEKTVFLFTKTNKLFNEETDSYSAKRLEIREKDIRTFLTDYLEVAKESAEKICFYQAGDILLETKDKTSQYDMGNWLEDIHLATARILTARKDLKNFMDGLERKLDNREFNL